mgnify:CR=1 FL=1
MNDRQEKIKNMKADLVSQIEMLKHSENYLKFLEFSKSFRTYSFFNRCFIYKQNPVATYVQGFRQWKKMDRIVKKGEKGIAIFVPMFFKEKKEEEERKEERKASCFTIGYVFDIAQTEGTELFEPVSKILACSNSGHDAMFQRILQNPELNILETELSSSIINGYFDSASDKIYINSKNNATMKIKTICHELAHKFLLHSTKTKIELREVQAEACAFLACSLLGIDSSDYSVGYIASYSNESKSVELLNDFKLLDCVVLKIVDCFEY